MQQKKRSVSITAENSSFPEQLVSLKSVWSRDTKMKAGFHYVINYCQETSGLLSLAQVFSLRNGFCYLLRISLFSGKICTKLNKSACQRVILGIILQPYDLCR